MDRRQFCKIASMALGAVGIGGVNAFGADGISGAAIGLSGAANGVNCAANAMGNQAKMPRKCRVTVVRRECYIDLQAVFLDDPDAGPCESFQSGEEFAFSAGDERPSRFCPRLWQMICSTLSATVDEGISCSTPHSKDALALSCPDGTRPVIVRIDLESD